MEVLVCLLVGYACGNLLTAELVARRELGRSAFDVGVGNPGMANIGHELGLRAAALTLAGDLGKVVAAALVCSLAFPDLGSASAAWAGLGCTLGHNFPAWHHLKGGKGVATTCATIVLASPGWGVLALLVGLAAVVLSGYLCVGAIAIAASYALLMLLAGDLAHVIVALALLALMAMAHGSAVAGIRDGSTPRASLADKVRSLLPFDLPGVAAGGLAPGTGARAHGAGSDAHAAHAAHAAGEKSLGLRRAATATEAPGRSDGGFFTRGSFSLDALLHGEAGSDDSRRVRSRVGKVSPGDTLAYPRIRPRVDGTAAACADASVQAAGAVSDPVGAPAAASQQPASPADMRAQAALGAPSSQGTPAPAPFAVDKTVAMPRVVAAPADTPALRAQAVRVQAADQVRPMIPALEAQRMASQQRLQHERQAAAEEVVRIGRFVGEGAHAASRSLAQAGNAAAQALGRARAASADELERRRTLERRRASAAARDDSLTQRPSAEGRGRGPRTPPSRPRPAQGQVTRPGQATRATRSQRPQVGRGPVRDARPSRAPRAPQPTTERTRPKHAQHLGQGRGPQGPQDARHPQRHEAHQAHVSRHRS